MMKLSLLTMFACLLTISAPSAAPVTLVDDLGREVSLDRVPIRIVSDYDVDVTIPLIELGVVPVASHGRLGANGKPQLRSSNLLTGVDFDNSDIAFIGSSEIDLEAVAALKPDLIITEISRSTPVEKLERLAPTIVVNSDLGTGHLYKLLAAATGREKELSRLEARYREQIKLLKSEVDTEKVSVSVFQPLRGKLNVYHSYGSLGQVLRDAGFRFAPIMNEIPEGRNTVVSAERLPDLDADVVFDPYRSDRKNGAKIEISLMSKIVPGFCQYLAACRNGRYVLVPREEVMSHSYAALSRMTAIVQTALGPRPTGIKMPKGRDN